MFFLIRMMIRLALFAGLLLLLVPFALKGEAGKEVSVFDAFGAAQAFVADARGFCDRQPQACAVGGQMLSHVGEKAHAGLKWVYESLGDGRPADAGHGAAPAQRPAGPLDLTPQDLAPTWGGTPGAQPVMPPSATQPQPAAPPVPPRRPA